MSTKKVGRKNGLGDMFHNSNPQIYAFLGGTIYILIILLSNPIYLIPLFSFVVGEIITAITYRKIDGFTGDVYGATIELTEIVSLVVFMEVIKWI